MPWQFKPLEHSNLLMTVVSEQVQSNLFMNTPPCIGNMQSSSFITPQCKTQQRQESFFSHTNKRFEYLSLMHSSRYLNPRPSTLNLRKDRICLRKKWFLSLLSLALRGNKRRGLHVPNTWWSVHEQVGLNLFWYNSHEQVGMF
jgi:hypothetical protein